MATAQAMMAARQRRQQRFDTRVEWLGDRLSRGVRMGMQARVRIAAQLLRDKVVINISVPVVKQSGRRNRRGQFQSGTKVTQRSSPGEFPRADTTRLMKDIFYDVGTRGGQIRAIIGTTLDYGLILETSPRLNRAFLLPTLEQMRPQITRILTARNPPMPGDNQ